MAKHSNIYRAPQDESQLAKSIIDLITTQGAAKPKPEKNAAVVSPERLCESKGSEASTEKLAPAKRSRIR